MAAATLPAWLALQPAARTLRAFCTAVSPATRSAIPSPRTAGRASRYERPLRRKALPPRTEKMTVDLDWPSVYPVAAPFKPSAVPLPVRMGYPVKRGVPMAKEGNLELLKIPNFLHLTPVAIKKHCEALKDFCTEWPAALDSDEKCEKHFPIEIDTADYVSAGPSIRNPKARVVTLRVKLSSLNLDDHAKKKLIKLVGERYCKTTDVLTIRTDRCPLKRQNYDYAIYLLTVLYHESWAVGRCSGFLGGMMIQSRGHFSDLFAFRKPKNGRKRRLRQIWKSIYGKIAPLKKISWKHFSKLKLLRKIWK
ncbi:28S ribosomal protein S35, mitochondrial isoform X2 [Prionailurus bengalensis]|uniref:small ribosomal subunit protein mS35 isoform X2 n=1 Tax=Herpailurus yagouaroundi TaxID=1608482 RepID=UPI000F42AF48|nr:28S ribosomal protein S35, mitochondrial isoform X2 [Puma yagouaroundi]XP_043417604.1 28S ribosomal protein S35, mitochondrial isoform X2 [Prionailurus bengalensis]